MADFITNAGPWFRVHDGEIVAESWGLPDRVPYFEGSLRGQPMDVIRGCGWYPGVEVGRAIFDPTYYSQGRSVALTGTTVTITYAAPVARDLTMVKKAAVDRVDREEFAALQPTDWAVVRKADTGADIPPEIASARAFARAAATAAKAAIAAASDVGAVAAVFPIQWSV